MVKIKLVCLVTVIYNFPSFIFRKKLFLFNQDESVQSVLHLQGRTKWVRFSGLFADNQRASIANERGSFASSERLPWAALESTLPKNWRPSLGRSWRSAQDHFDFICRLQLHRRRRVHQAWHFRWLFGGHIQWQVPRLLRQFSQLYTSKFVKKKFLKFNSSHYKGVIITSNGKTKLQAEKAIHRANHELGKMRKHFDFLI